MAEQFCESERRAHWALTNLVPLIIRKKKKIKKRLGEAIELCSLQRVRADEADNFRDTMEM